MNGGVEASYATNDAATNRDSGYVADRVLLEKKLQSASGSKDEVRRRHSR